MRKEEGGNDPADPLPHIVQRVHRNVKTLEDTARIVADATGRIPDLSDPGMAARFDDLRDERARQNAKSVYKWNAALRGLEERAKEKPELLAEVEQLLAFGGGGVMAPTSIEMYSKWTLEEIVPVSKRSAIFKFTSKDRYRGTPHPRGRGLRPNPITWHTTLLGKFGHSTDEGPFPWVERDYTPISSAKEWEQGRCDILIKIYPDGAATSWLHRTRPTSVWLSRPVKTLSVPSLVANGSSFQPSSVLLLLAGTGCVALPQIIHHRDPIHKLGMATPKRQQLQVPIDVILSFREDDVLLCTQTAEMCRSGDIRHATVLITSSNSGAPPFPSAKVDDASELGKLDNASIVRSRLTFSIISSAIAKMPSPCRVLVSGPRTFNTAAREMLARARVSSERITILTST